MLWCVRGSWNIELQKTGYIREAGRSMVVKANVQNQPITMYYSTLRLLQPE